MRQSVGLMGLPAPAMGYDGIVQAGGQQIQVVDGVMELGGHKLHVSEDGQVTDDQDKPIAKVVNGQVIPIQQQQPAQQQAQPGMGA